MVTSNLRPCLLLNVLDRVDAPCAEYILLLGLEDMLSTLLLMVDEGEDAGSEEEDDGLHSTSNFLPV